MSHQPFDPYMKNLQLIDPIMAQQRSNSNAHEKIPCVWTSLVSAVSPVVPISDRYNARYTIVDFCRMLLTASSLDTSIGGTVSNRKALQKYWYTTAEFAAGEKIPCGEWYNIRLKGNTRRGCSRCPVLSMSNA